MKQLFLIIITLTTIASYQNDASCQSKDERFKIAGHIDGIEDSTLVTLYSLDESINLDSSYAINGDFIFEGRVESPSSCYIRCEDDYANIQVENVEMTFKAPIKDMHLHSKITGGKEQKLQNELKKLQEPYNVAYYGAYDSLVNKKYTSEVDKQQLIKRFNDSQSIARDIYIKFGKDHAGTYFGLNIIYMNRGSISKDSLKLIIKNLSPEIKSSSVASALKTYLFEETAEEGKPFIDFTVKTLKGEDFSLSSQKGNYIYLSFWEAGCGPCRIENRFLSENFDRVPEKLSLVSFSIDKNIKNWAKASATDSIVWHNVSDLEGGKGSIKTQYNVQAIPASFLINQEGIIIKRFKGFDPDVDLIEKLIAIMDKGK